MRGFLNLISAFFAYFTGQNSSRCDYFQNVGIGETYYVYSPNYPRNYAAGLKCRWSTTCPAGYNCRLNCTDISLPTSPECSGDKLVISASGDDNLKSADVYCGEDTAVVTSESTRMTIGLEVGSNSAGGKFLCQLTAVPDTSNTSCTCGYKKRSRIVGGDETEVNEYPMMAAIALATTFSIECGAVIIDHRYVLTAAHCVTGRNASLLAVIVGEHDITVGDSPATAGFRVVNYTIHPQYDAANPPSDYDIALVKTDRVIRFGNRVGPVCLPFKFADTNFTGEKVTAIGWGDLGFGGPTSDTLQEVDLDVISDETCRGLGLKLTPRQFCTFTKGKDTCQRDSGGPLLYTENSTGTLYNLGIVSYGTFCASDKPGVSTRVTELLEWITATATDAHFCRK